MVRALTLELSTDDTAWKPSPDRFSIAEVIAHLAHSERNCYRLRLDRFLAEDRPELALDDAQMWLDLYRHAGAAAALHDLEQQRKTNVDFLRSLPAEAGLRVAMHLEVGEITLSNMLHEWVLHDLGHLRQIAEIVRARKYCSGAGPLASYYRLAP